MPIARCIARSAKIGNDPLGQFLRLAVPFERITQIFQA